MGVRPTAHEREGEIVKRTLVAFLFGPEESGPRRLARRLIGAPQDGVTIGGRPGEQEGGRAMEAPSVNQCPACQGLVASTAAACPHCGHRPEGTTGSGSLNIAAAVILLSGVLFAAGSFLPWATVTGGFVSISRSGMEGGDGMITIFLGVALALLGLTRLQSPGLPGNRLVMVLLGVIAIGVAWFEGTTIQTNIAASTSAYVTGSVGMGIYAMGVAGVLVVLTSMFGEPNTAKAA